MIGKKFAVVEIRQRSVLTGDILRGLRAVHVDEVHRYFQLFTDLRSDIRNVLCVRTLVAVVQRQSRRGIRSDDFSRFGCLAKGRLKSPLRVR